MLYGFSFTNSCRKDFRKISRDAQEYIRYAILPAILKDPHSGNKLQGREFKGFFKFGMRYKAIDYRIVYKIDNKEFVIIFVMIAVRENFYKCLKKRV